MKSLIKRPVLFNDFFSKPLLYDGCAESLLSSLIEMLLPWDGVRHHTGENMKNFLGEQNEGLAKSEWKITCELFAPYAPEENPDFMISGLRKSSAITTPFFRESYRALRSRQHAWKRN